MRASVSEAWRLARDPDAPGLAHHAPRRRHRRADRTEAAGQGHRDLPESAPLELEPEGARDVEIEATAEPIEDEGAPMEATVEAIDVAPDVLAALLPDSAPMPASPLLEASAAEDETEAADAGLGPVSGQAGVGKRIRRALWRFLASLPGAEEGNETPPAPAAEA